MSKTCCVEGCLVTKEDVSYFPLPIKPALRRKWRDAIGTTTTNMSNFSLICSRHFTKDDYELIRGKTRLKAKVVPSVFGDQIPTPKSPHQNNIEETNDTPETETKTDETKTVANKKTKKIKRKKRKQNHEEEDKESDSENQESGYVEVPIQESGDVDVPVFGEDLISDVCMDDDSQENCTIECIPEAVLTQDSGTESEPELHKEDIEDIIANYHIKQDKKLAERLMPQEIQENQENGIQESKKQDGEKKEIGKKQESNLPPDKFECIEVEFEPEERKDKDPVFIEISVDQANVGAGNQDDCLMLLEDVHVDIDPASLLHDDDGADDDDNKADPISLLTSSDDDDVILQEPHVDTVEVSDETDEDDQPLVKLVNSETVTLQKILWGNLREYYCMVCHFKTTSRVVYMNHKKEHNSTVIQMCEICNFTSASKAQFARHKKKHKDEKRYKCHICEYKAKHKMSLIYHLKSHENVTVNSLNVKSYKGYFQCQKCKFHTNDRPDILRHIRKCKTKVDRFYNCNRCEYKSKRRSDLTRHQMRKHAEFKDADDGEDDEYVPPSWAV